jgi:hypothetical protein
VNGEAMTADRHLARRVAAAHGLPGVPVSMRSKADLPGAGAGTGHWARKVAELTAEVDRTRRAVAAAPAGALRDELDRVHGLLDRRLARFTRIAEVGHALLPDDDHTEADGTLPGETPVLRGAAAEIDARLADAVSHLAGLTVAVERLAAALGGQADAEAVRAELARLHADEPA